VLNRTWGTLQSTKSFLKTIPLESTFLEKQACYQRQKVLKARMMKKLPFVLIYSRILLAISILPLVFLQVTNYEIWIAVLLIAGLLSDIFDGIIARQQQVSSEKLRTWDSNADQLFWLIALGSIAFLRSEILLPLQPQVILILVLEGLTYLISYSRFKRTVATHSLLAKLWTLSLLTFLIEVLLFETSHSFSYCFWLALISRAEIIAILLLLKEWTTDVPSVWVVAKINRGEKVKKSKWFNS
jgi:CDP-diacylglycerol--glycerol-3-phosphate 3-phosphatidyltransferase